MDSHTGMVVVLAVLITTTGCIGLFDSTQNGDQPYTTPLTETTVTSANEDALSSVESFRYTVDSVTYVSTQPDQRQSVTIFADVDLSSRQVYVQQRLSPTTTVEAFASPDSGAYRRQNRDDTVQYQQIPAEQVNETAFTRPVTLAAVDNLSYEYNGTSTDNGTTVHSYHAAEQPSSADTLGISLGVIQTVETARSSIKVTESGAIRSFRLHVTGTGPNNRTLIYRTTVQYRQLGETQVNTREWLSEAQREAGN